MKAKLNIFLIFILIFINFWSSASYAQQGKNLLKKFELTRKRLEFARSYQVSMKDSSRAEDLLNKAEINLRRAYSQFRARRPFAANRSMNEANNSINKAIKILLKEPMKKRKEKLEELVREAESIVPNSENVQAQKAMDNGLQNRTLAFQAYIRNNFQKSFEFYNQAYQQLLIAINLVKNKDKDASVEVENEAYRFNQFFELNKKIINTNKNQAVKEYKQLAFKQVRKAEKAKQNRNFGLAIDHYRRATRLLNRAFDIALGKTDKSEIRIDYKVAQLDELIENIEQRLEQNKADEQLLFQMSRLKQLQKETHQALDNKNFGIALNKAKLAQELIERIYKKIKRGK